jgi:hypothetical protein
MVTAGLSKIDFTVIDLEWVEVGDGRAAMATVEILLGDAVLTLQGVRLTRSLDVFTAEAPSYHDPRTGCWQPAAIIPEELGAAIAKEVHRLLEMPDVGDTGPQQLH